MERVKQRCLRVGLERDSGLKVGIPQRNCFFFVYRPGCDGAKGIKGCDEISDIRVRLPVLGSGEFGPCRKLQNHVARKRNLSEEYWEVIQSREQEEDNDGQQPERQLRIALARHPSLSH